MRNKKASTLLSIIILTLVTGTLIVQNYKDTINEEIKSHLINNRGYTEMKFIKLLHISVRHLWLALPLFFMMRGIIDIFTRKKMELYSSKVQLR